MNVQISDTNETRKTLVVTLDKSEVDGVYKTVVGEFTKFAHLPGFRPGRAPAELVVKRYGKELQDEFKNKVVSKAYSEGVEQAKIDVISLVDVEPGTVEAGLSAAIKFTVDLRPEFTLPDYVGLETEVQPTDPTETEIDQVVEGLRQERADFKVVDRTAQKGDYVRFGYEGSLDGKSIAELVGDKGIYAKAPQTWEEIGGPDGILPGMGAQLAGAKAGDKKTASIVFPAEFPAAPALGGKTVSYAIDVQEVRERVLPPLDDAFFKAHNVENIDGLRAQIQGNLKTRKEYENRAAQRRQITDALVVRGNFPVPESLIASERDGVLRQFIEENMRRGVPQEQFEQNKKDLYESASRAALSRVKVQLMLAKIAQAEKLTVEKEDFNKWLMREAMRSGERPDKLAKELGKERSRLHAVQQQILFDKTLDFLVAKATVKLSATAKA
ncbi:MAG: trigger factor [Opitutaceae bacterium]|nr:trigger factor [Opitutaceae bacterium]